MAQPLWTKWKFNLRGWKGEYQTPKWRFISFPEEFYELIDEYDRRVGRRKSSSEELDILHQNTFGILADYMNRVETFTRKWIYTMKGRLLTVVSVLFCYTARAVGCGYIYMRLCLQVVSWVTLFVYCDCILSGGILSHYIVYIVVF
jgi:hypothetical protein